MWIAAVPSICHNSICLNLASSRRHLGTTTHLVPGHGMRRDGRGRGRRGRRARRLSCRRIWRRSKSLSAIGSFARSTPDKLALDSKHLRNLYPADEKEGVAIRTGYRPLPPPQPMPPRRRRCRSEPIRVGGGERTEQKNSAVADTKLPSQYGKLFQLNRGIQIEFRESPPISPRHKDDGLKTRILGENDSF